MNGEIPLELIGLGALEILGLSGGFHGVGLRGEIPPELGNLSNLRDLSIEGNGLTGEIPPELGNLASLQHLRLRGEGLSGGIPPELGNLKQLYGLYIYSTQLGGAIPPELGNISLRELHHFDNEFSGEIPPWLGNHSYLIGLSLDGNQLSGEIPAEWGNFYSVILENWGTLEGGSPGGLRLSGSHDDGTEFYVTYPEGAVGTGYLSLWWSDDHRTYCLRGWYKDGDLTSSREDATAVEFSGRSAYIHWNIPAHPSTLPSLGCREQ